MIKPYNILGVQFHPVTQSQTLSLIEEYIASGNFHYIVTPNPEFLVLAQKDLQFRQILNNANLSIADGIGILWAAKHYHTPLPEKVTGTDTMINFMPIAAKKGYKIFLLGGTPGIVEKTKHTLLKKYPNLNVVGADPGPIINNDDDLKRSQVIVEKINQSQADILFVAFGAPKQEKFISYFQNQLKVKVAIGIGGAFDYISGKTTRAPMLLRRLGLEWFYRLITNPSRIKRIWQAVITFPILVLTYHKPKELP